MVDMNVVIANNISRFLEKHNRKLTTIPQNYEETDVFRVFMGKVGTEEYTADP